MSNNISGNTKQLAIKSELLRHLGTATSLAKNNQPSSMVKVGTLLQDIANYENVDYQRLEFWRMVVEHG